MGAVGKAGELCKQAMSVVKISFGEVKEIYAKQKSEIEASLKFSPGIYNGAIAMVYAVLQAPPTLFKNAFGSIPGAAFSLLYSVIIFPLKTILQVFDFRSMKNFFSTIWYFVSDCLPNSLRSILTKVMTTLSDYYSATMKAVKGQKKIDSLKKSLMLTESKAQHFEIKIWDWFKGTVRSIAEKAKNTVWYFLKGGLSIIEKAFMTVIYPFTECMARTNKLPAGVGSSINLEGSMLNKLLSAMGLGSIITGLTGVGAMFPAAVVTAFSYFLVFMSTMVTVYTIASVLNMVGQVIEFKNMIVDAFEVSE